MNESSSDRVVTICVLTFGSFPDLPTRCIDSIIHCCDRRKYLLFVAGNSVCQQTERYLRSLASVGSIDRLFLSEANINKCRMMRQMLNIISTDLIWWFDDDSYIVETDALERRLEIAAAAPPSTVIWGHEFYSSETDFNRDQDMVSFVLEAPWYKGKQPPSWKPGGKGEYDFEGKGTGDGRWFFITGGCWMARTSSLRELDWPEPTLVKCADDVLLCEAIRQQGWTAHDIGPLGVEINTHPRRGDGEDAEVMRRQVLRVPSAPLIRGADSEAEGHGCLFIPTFADTQLLAENFADRPNLTDAIDIYIIDDNCDGHESLRVRKLCEANGWTYVASERGRHGNFHDERSNYVGYNRVIWETFTKLGANYDYVVKAETDTYIISEGCFDEFRTLLTNRIAIAGSLEYRPIADVITFWEIAEKAGFSFTLSSHVLHVQGGIYGLSKDACGLLNTIGLLRGRHVNFRDDCYISYCCQLAKVGFNATQSVGSWFAPRRPDLATIADRKAIHPLSRSEWCAFEQLRYNGQPTLTTAIGESLYSPTPKIPRRAHFVWLGSPLPELAKDNIRRFRRHHPEWEVLVCTSIPKELPAELRDAVLAAPKIAMRSDIIRLWLLYEHGGVYLDTDVYTLRSIEPLLKYEHFVPLEKEWSVNNAVIGAAQRSPTIAKLLDRVRLRSVSRPEYILTYGPQLFTDFWRQSGTLNVLPIHYFCLLPEHEDADAWLKLSETEKQQLAVEWEINAQNGVAPFGVHLWGLPPKNAYLNLRESSFVEGFGPGDFMLRNMTADKSAGAFVGPADMSLVSYLVHFHGELLVWLSASSVVAGENGAAHLPRNCVTATSEDLKDVPDASLDWPCFNSSRMPPEFSRTLTQFLPKLADDGKLFGHGQFPGRDRLARMANAHVSEPTRTDSLWMVQLSRR